MKPMLIAMLSGLLLAAPALARPAGNACKSPEHHQLDFWKGTWKAYQTKAGAFDGDSLIEPIYGDCVIRENWKDANGMVGGSFNRFDRTTGGWRQTWVDSNGRQTDYVGAWKGDRMEYVARAVSPKDHTTVVLHRMTLSPLPDGTVRQFFEDSSDDGKTWTPVWDLIYRRVTPTGG